MRGDDRDRGGVEMSGRDRDYWSNTGKLGRGNTGVGR